MNTKKYIKNSPRLPLIVAPVSHAVVTCNYCHTSGQLSWDKSGNFISGTVLKEAKLAFKNLFAVLKEANFAKDDIVFLDIAFKNLAHLEIITPFYQSLFEESKQPARTIYQVSELPYGAKIKILAIAIRLEKQTNS